MGLFGKRKQKAEDLSFLQSFEESDKETRLSLPNWEKICKNLAEELEKERKQFFSSRVEFYKKYNEIPVENDVLGGKAEIALIWHQFYGARTRIPDIENKERFLWELEFNVCGSKSVDVSYYWDGLKRESQTFDPIVDNTSNDIDLFVAKDILAHISGIHRDKVPYAAASHTSYKLVRVRLSPALSVAMAFNNAEEISYLRNTLQNMS